MTRRIAATLALIAFGMSLIVGLQAENSFVTVVGRALLALVVTFAVGLILGAMLEKMLAENLKNRVASAAQAEKMSNTD